MGETEKSIPNTNGGVGSRVCLRPPGSREGLSFRAEGFLQWPLLVYGWSGDRPSLGLPFGDLTIYFGS